MFHTETHRQGTLDIVNMDELVPEDHLLRKIDETIDFSFIAEKTRPLYSPDNGRPCLDPVKLFKMLFIGYLYGIRSERRLVEEVRLNIAYRWFVGLSLSDPVPHPSTFSQNRRRRFHGTTIFQDIFDEIVQQGMEHGLIDGEELFTDSTFLKANANPHKYTEEVVPAVVTQSPAEYIAELDRAIEEERRERKLRALKKKTKETAPETKKTKVSTTDPESGYMVRDGKPRGFFYLDHRTVDGKHNLITDVYVTPGNIHDSKPYLARLKRQKERFGFSVKAVALDAGYLTSPICHALKEQGIFAVIAHRRFRPNKELFHKWQYRYDSERDVYVCPAGHELTYRTTNRQGYREYKSDPKICKTCPMLSRCTRSQAHVKTVTRHIWEDAKEWVRQNRLSERGKALYKRRKETVERSFADAKELHGLRYARMRGLAKVTEQCLLTACAQNLKKMALLLWKRSRGPGNGPRLLVSWAKFHFFFQTKHPADQIPFGSLGFVINLAVQLGRPSFGLSYGRFW